MVKAKFSTTFKAKMQRIKRLPKLVNNSADAIVRKDALGIIEEYRKGIERNNFGLEPLAMSTIIQKQRQGKPKPRTPLYGEGKGQSNSLINALGIRKLKNGYRVYRRKAKHHEADMSVGDLLTIHENGALIKQKRGGKTIIIRIPPRPVLDKAIQRYLRKKQRLENTKMVKKAIGELINKGKENEFNRVKKFKGREMMEFGI